MITHYPEILLLQSFYSENTIEIILDNSSTIDPSFIPVSVLINKISYIIQIQDEYDDLKVNNQLLWLVLVLREIEMIEDSTDHLDWSKQQSVKENPLLADYYNDFIASIAGFKHFFKDGKITSFITDLDFQLNAGAIQLLRKNRIN